jgi:cupin superfamily acireductone dioxygenase involved in methionine salvage
MLLSVLTYVVSRKSIPTQAMRVERGYDYEDTCTVSRETMPNYDEKIKSFFEEHIHSDEVRRA